MNIATYLRVSSEQQANRELSIPAQREALQAYAEAKGWEIVAEFVDEAKSAKTVDRPAFQRMIAMAQRPDKPFEAILVHKFDRFCRRREDHIIYKALLKRQGIVVLSATEPTDPDTPHGVLLEGMLEVISEFYNVNLKHETLKGLRENALQGFHCGGRAPYGYRLHRIGNRVTYQLGPEHEVQTVKQIFQWAAKGMGGKKIARLLNEQSQGQGKRWSPSTILSILSNEAYLGHRVWNKRSDGRPNSQEKWIVSMNRHPAIVDEELWNAAQASLVARKLCR